MDKDKVKNYYNSLLKKRIEDFVYGNERINRAYQEIQNWIEIYNPQSVLEIGCGIGNISFKIAENYHDLKILGTDISEVTIDFGNKSFSRTNLTLNYSSDFKKFEKYIGEEKFDFIFLIDVFEHLDDKSLEDFIFLLKGIMNHNCLLFLSCPTIRHQNYLRETDPAGIQPIDNDITIKDFLSLAEKLKLDLLFFKTISVWNLGDYQHTVIGKLKEYISFTDKIKQRKVGLKKQILNKIFKRKEVVSEYDLKRTELRRFLQ
jgi:SAM-dependent methyltransferase